MAALASPVRWGVLGTGAIARKLAAALREVPGAALAAVGSRRLDGAEAFAREHGAARAHGSYEALVSDRDVDVVYVSSPHSEHRAHARLALEAGKAVLCEKPFAVNASEAADVVALARSRGCFVMEAMWTRFLPITRQVHAWLRDGAIGEPRMLSADFGFRAPYDPAGRLFAPHLAGGALLDVGIYPVSYASFVFGRAPVRVAALGQLSPDGVDEQAAMVLGHDRGELAVLSCAVRTETVHEARIDGTDGRIVVPSFWRATTARLERPGRDPITVELPHRGGGYAHQLDEVHACLAAGRRESATMPLDETVAIMRTLDAVRGQLGVIYPQERPPS